MDTQNSTDLCINSIVKTLICNCLNTNSFIWKDKFLCIFYYKLTYLYTFKGRKVQVQNGGRLQIYIVNESISFSCINCHWFKNLNFTIDFQGTNKVPFSLFGITRRWFKSNGFYSCKHRLLSNGNSVIFQCEVFSFFIISLFGSCNGKYFLFNRWIYCSTRYFTHNYIRKLNIKHNIECSLKVFIRKSQISYKLYLINVVYSRTWSTVAAVCIFFVLPCICWYIKLVIISYYK